LSFTSKPTPSVEGPPPRHQGTKKKAGKIPTLQGRGPNRGGTTSRRRNSRSSVTSQGLVVPCCLGEKSEPNRASLAEDAGVYCLVLRLRRSRWVASGKLGHCRLAAGWYVYVGSAKRNLTARLTRHLRHEKRVHWHVDYLRAVARVAQIWVWPWTDGGECRTNAWIQALPGAVVPWTGFGSSDCGCASHLTAFAEEPAVCHGPSPIALVTNRGRSGFPRGWQLTPGSKRRILPFARWTGAAKEQP